MQRTATAIANRLADHEERLARLEALEELRQRAELALFLDHESEEDAAR